MQTSMLLVHAHALFREGLRYCATQSQFRVVGEAWNGQQAIQFVEHANPQIVLMEVDLPGINGIEVARAIKRSHPDIHIVLLSAVCDIMLILHAIRAGVAALEPRNSSWEHLLRILHRVLSAEYPIHDLVLSTPEAATQVFTLFRAMTSVEDTRSSFAPLSIRELQVIELIAFGYANKEIAARLDISGPTVKAHVSSILRKLAVHDRTQAVVYAMRRGWIRSVRSG